MASVYYVSFGEVEVGVSGVQGHPWLSSEFWASLVSMRQCLRKIRNVVIGGHQQDSRSFKCLFSGKRLTTLYTEWPSRTTGVTWGIIACEHSIEIRKDKCSKAGGWFCILYTLSWFRQHSLERDTLCLGWGEWMSIWLSLNEHWTPASKIQHLLRSCGPRLQVGTCRWPPCLS